MIILSPTGRGMAFFEFLVGKGLSLPGGRGALFPPRGSSPGGGRSVFQRRTNNDQERRNANNKNPKSLVNTGFIAHYRTCVSFR